MLQLNLTKRAAAFLAQLEAAGFDVLASDDFAEIEALVQQTGQPLRAPMFDLRRNDFTRGQAFWLFLMEDGVPVGAVAAKRVDLGDEPFADYLSRVSEARFDMPEPLAEVARPVAARLQGQIIEFGELHFAVRRDAPRGVLRAFGAMAAALAAMSWPRFDWMYALVPPQQRALAEIYGFEITTPRALRWREPVPYPYDNAQAMIYTSRADFLHRLRSGGE